MKHILPYIHPFLFGLFPLLYAYQQYYSMTTPWELILPCVLIAGCIGIALVVIRRVGLDVEMSSILFTIGLILLFSTGYIRDTVPARLLPGVKWYILLVPVGIALLFLCYVTIRQRGHLGNVTRIISLIGIVLVFTAAIGIASQSLVSASPVEHRALQIPDRASGARPAGISDPDIYYIILDGYGSSTVLEKYYDLNNTGFESYLRTRGFYIANESASNYIKTKLSIPSSITMQYSGQITSGNYTDSRRYESLAIEQFKSNDIAGFLKSRGYKIILLRSGYFLTNQMDEADIIQNPGVPSTYEKALFEKTILWPVFNLLPQTNDLQRNRHILDQTFSALETVPSIPGKKFVFAHIIAPHEPYVFGPEGGLPENSTLYREGYRDQVVYVNTRIEQMIDRIIDNSSRSPVIVIQGDHGPRYLLADQRCMDESLRILNAYLLPGGGDRKLYPTITPVNSFRIIFDYYFNTTLGTLEDISYFNSAGYSFSNGEFHCLSQNISAGDGYVYCKGWAEPNVKSKKGFHWMTNNGTLLVYSDENKTLMFRFLAITNSRKRHLQIFVNGVLTGEADIGSVPADESFPLPLERGNNTIRFFVPDGEWATPVVGERRQYFNMGFGNFSFERCENE